MYLNLLGPLTEGKTRHKTPMGEELARAALALDLAASGRTTALVSSGDAGIYGMATVVFELLARKPKPEWAAVDIEVIPGISAMQATAARVGAPLAHDFCVISLSDLLTPWELIAKRIDLAGQGDFAIAFYNAVSNKRSWQLLEARQILLRYRQPETPVVVAFNVTRKGEQLTVTPPVSYTHLDVYKRQQGIKRVRLAPQTSLSLMPNISRAASFISLIVCFSSMVMIPS